MKKNWLVRDSFNSDYEHCDTRAEAEGRAIRIAANADGDICVPIYELVSYVEVKVTRTQETTLRQVPVEASKDGAQ